MSLPIQTLHTDIRNFMHRLKTIYELRIPNEQSIDHKRNIQNLKIHLNHRDGEQVAKLGGLRPLTVYCDNH